MAKKRLILTGNKEKQDPNPVSSSREMMASISWREWLREYFLKYWFIIGCIAIDAMIPLEILRITSEPFNYIYALIFLIIVIYGEVLVFMRFWGREKGLSE